jgi:hypothetical protein
VSKYLDYHLVYLSLLFFGGSLIVALAWGSLWPIGLSAAFVQFPLVTRSLDKYPRHGWRAYVMANELFVFVLAVASVAVAFTAGA